MMNTGMLPRKCKKEPTACDDYTPAASADRWMHYRAELDCCTFVEKFNPGDQKGDT